MRLQVCGQMIEDALDSGLVGDAADRAVAEPAEEGVAEAVGGEDAVQVAAHDLAVLGNRALGHKEGPGWTCHEEDGGWRIDYALVTADLTDRLRAISVDHAAQGSDHQPIRVEIEL